MLPHRIFLAYLTHLLQALLFHVSPTDALTLAGVAFLMAALTVIASFLPARRAIRVDPMKRTMGQRQ